MTIDEAIRHAEEVAEEHTKYNIYGGFESCDECAKEHRQLVEWLKELKQLREQPSWIPVSERLPEDKTYVLTTIKIPNRIAHARSGWYEGGFFHNDNGDVWKATDMEVIAWMPLPESYKVESDIEKLKPCINYEDGCEEWAGCPCVYYKSESEG